MTLIFKNEYIAINWLKSGSVLKVTWSQINEYLSLLKLNQVLASITKHIEYIQLKLFIFAASNFNYRSTTELKTFFQAITLLIRTTNIALINSNSFLGKHTISLIVKEYSFSNLFEIYKEMISWIKSKVLHN